VREFNENDFPPLEPQPFVSEEGREIERLRAKLAAAKAQLATNADELAAMQKQRDEAMDIAATHKRNWYEAKTEYGAAMGKIRAELAAMREQRDEARRLHCVEITRESMNPKRFTAEWAAKQLGWDCFKEGGGA
jgi:chromosome segregation ATPase